ncbi:MAG: alpha-hydroxy acid oxidase [Prochloraceae cyanobacterium]
MKQKPVNLLEYESLAKKHLSPIALDYYASGAMDEKTLKNNRSAFDRYKILPKMLRGVAKRDLSTTILGQPLSLPILIAPMAFQCLATPSGELATARAAVKLDIAMVLSTLSTKSLEEVASVGKKLWFQLYVHRDRELTRILVERAEKAGYQALCLTVDAPILGIRDCDRRNQFTLPPHLQIANLASIKDLKIPQTEGESGLYAYFARQLDPGLTWQDLEWLASITKLPIAVKGILRADDAIKALEYGAKAIIVSNHGGRQLDGAIATIDALGDITAAVGDKIDVLIDGGIRRGNDILKALAIGAKAILIGRPLLWGLAVDGENGAKHVLEMLANELDNAMALSGCVKLQDINTDLVKQI